MTRSVVLTVLCGRIFGSSGFRVVAFLPSLGKINVLEFVSLGFFFLSLSSIYLSKMLERNCCDRSKSIPYSFLFFFFSFREEISEVDFFNWKIWKIEDD